LGSVRSFFFSIAMMTADWEIPNTTLSPAVDLMALSRLFTPPASDWSRVSEVRPVSGQT